MLVTDTPALRRFAELPDEWSAAVDRWSAAAPVPDAATAHLLWQTVAGSEARTADGHRRAPYYNDRAFETRLRAALPGRDVRCGSFLGRYAA